MRLQNRISKLESSRPPEHQTFIRAIVETDGGVEVIGSDITFPTEKEFDSHYRDKPVNVIKRKMVDPEITT